MKKMIVTLLTGMGILCTGIIANAQEFKEKTEKEFALSGDLSKCMLVIYNVSGFIKVEGYSGTKIIMEIDKTINADNNKNLETGKKEFSLGFSQKSDTIIAYIASPFDSRPRRNWQYNNDNREIEYDYNVDFTVKVPYGINLHISTVNNGIITVNNVTGNLNVNNVNEEISIKNAKGTTIAHTVNGDVTVNYVSNPPEESSYYTINGNIRVSYKSDLSADLQFKSMNGDFYTDFPEIVLLPATTKIIQNKKGEGTVYKLNAITSVRFGKGGKIFKFETLNGNIYIKKQS